MRQILEKAKPAEHGVILRTAAQHITKEEIELSSKDEKINFRASGSVIKFEGFYEITMYKKMTLISLNFMINFVGVILCGINTDMKISKLYAL